MSSDSTSTAKPEKAKRERGKNKTDVTIKGPQDVPSFLKAWRSATKDSSGKMFNGHGPVSQEICDLPPEALVSTIVICADALGKKAPESLVIAANCVNASSMLIREEQLDAHYKEAAKGLGYSDLDAFAKAQNPAGGQKFKNWNEMRSFIIQSEMNPAGKK